MALLSLWRGLLGLEHTAVENVRWDGDVLVIDVRPMARNGRAVGDVEGPAPVTTPGGPAAVADAGSGHHDHDARGRRAAGALRRARRGRAVPWAAHGAGHTHTFDEQVAWLATRAQDGRTELMRIAWRTVGAIIARVWADIEAGCDDRLDGLRRIGIDEIAYKRGQRYLTVVVDHDSGRLVWAAPGRDRATLRTFFDELGPERCAQITHVSGRRRRLDRRRGRRTLPRRGAVRRSVPRRQVGHRSPRRGPPPGLERRSPATRARATGRGRRAAGSRRAGATARASSTPATRSGRTPRTSPTRQHDKLAWIAKTDPRLTAPTCSKKRPARVRRQRPGAAKRSTAAAWARRCRIPAFVHLAKHPHAPRHGSTPRSSTGSPTP